MYDNQLLSLLQLTDPALPIGGYAHSSGLETYVQNGLVKDLASAKEFVTAMLSYSLRYTDAAFVSFTHDAVTLNDWDRIMRLDLECTAVKLPSEIRQASNKLAVRLLKIFVPVCTDMLTRKYLEAIQSEKACGNYCIAFGICAVALKIPKAETLAGFYFNAASGIITNCVKLIPLGQQQGQKLLFSLQTVIHKLVQDTLQPDPSLLGLCCPGFDMRCMQHERLYSRLYMS